MRLPSCANLREHWHVRAKRAREHRDTGRVMTKVHFRTLKVGERATITLTRIAPRGLDSDNVASAFKAFRDGLADALEVDDGSPFLDWRYAQEKGTARVLVTIETLEGR